MNIDALIREQDRVVRSLVHEVNREYRTLMEDRRRGVFDSFLTSATDVVDKVFQKLSKTTKQQYVVVV